MYWYLSSMFSSYICFYPIYSTFHSIRAVLQVTWFLKKCPILFNSINYSLSMEYFHPSFACLICPGKSVPRCPWPLGAVAFFFIKLCNKSTFVSVSPASRRAGPPVLFSGSRSAPFWSCLRLRHRRQQHSGNIGDSNNVVQPFSLSCSRLAQAGNALWEKLAVGNWK